MGRRLLHLLHIVVCTVNHCYSHLSHLSTTCPFNRFLIITILNSLTVSPVRAEQNKEALLSGLVRDNLYLFDAVGFEAALLLRGERAVDRQQHGITSKFIVYVQIQHSTS
jgi:hypothetical protein